MSIITTLATAADVAQTAATLSPNWVLIGFIVGIFACFIVGFLIPLKTEAIEDKSKKKEPKAIAEDKSDNNDKKETVDKENLSLAEIKESKRQNVSEEKSKEEMRKLRQERRADKQTQNAIHDREEAEKNKAEQNDADTKEESKTEEKVEASQDTDVKAEAQTQDAEVKAEETTEKKSEEKTEEKSESFGSLFAAQASSTEDIFDTFFDNNDFGDEDSIDDDEAIIPTLGSALIPLDAMRAAAAAENSDDADFGLFNGLLNMSDDAEKKTQE